MQACAIEPEVRYFRTSKSDLSRVVRSRPLVKGNEDAGYEGVASFKYMHSHLMGLETRNLRKSLGPITVTLIARIISISTEDAKISLNI